MPNRSLLEDHKVKTPFIMLIVASLAAFPLFSQRTTGELLGTVKDSSGAVIPGVQVTVRQMDTGLTRTAVTDGTGNYLATLLPVGRYEVTAEIRGFKKKVVSGIILQVDQSARIDLDLDVGETTEVVEVKGLQQALTNTDSANVGTVVESRAFQALPINKRNFMGLIQLDAGALKPAGFYNSVFDMFGGHSNSYGSPADGSRFTLDGVDFKGVAYSRIEIRPSADAVQEFKQQSSTASAEFGLNSGMQVNLVTKSGTNQLHGSLFEYFRHSALNARNFFDPPRPVRRAQGLSEIPQFQFNQFGGSIGGPIKRNNTFYFLNYEGSRERKARTRLVSVPPLDMRRGDFSSVAQQIFDPATLDPTTGRRQPFPRNTIPASRLDPVAQRVLFGTGQQKELFPLPDRPGVFNNLLPTRTSSQDEDQVNARLDHRFSDADSVFGRYTLHHQRRVLRFNRYLHQLPNFADNWNTPSENARIGWTRVIGARMVNEFKLGYMRMTQFLQDVEMGTPVNDRLGITGTSKIFQFNPIIAITGFNSSGPLANAPNNRSENTYLIGDTLAYNVGKHGLGFGGDIRQRQQNGGAQFFASGQFKFHSPVHDAAGRSRDRFCAGRFRFGISDLEPDQPRGRLRQSQTEQYRSVFQRRLESEWGIDAQSGRPLGVLFSLDRGPRSSVQFRSRARRTRDPGTEQQVWQGHYRAQLPPLRPPIWFCIAAVR